MITATVEEATPGHSILVIRLVAIAMLLDLLWPVPTMVGYSNPAEGVVLGRYTLLYFGLLVAYLIAVMLWAGCTAWLWVRFDDARLRRWQRWGEANASLLVGGFSIFSLSMFGYTFALQSQLIALPAGVQERMEVSSLVFYGLSCLGMGVAFGPAVAARQPAGRGDIGLLLIRYWHLLALLAGGVALTMVAFSRGLLSFPVYKDASVHLYIGQRVLQGDIPYRDVFYFHPPLRFAISSLWAAIAWLSGLPLVLVGRVLNLLLALGLVGITFAIGQGLTKQRFGGLLSVMFLLFMSPLFIAVVDFSPTLKLVIGFLIGLAVLLAQHRRWLWAGIVAACAILMWLPAGGVGLALIVVVLLQRDEPNGPRSWWPALRSLALGAAIPLVTTVIVLSAAGVMIPALRQIAGGVFGFLSSSTPGDEQSSLFASLAKGVTHFAALSGGPALTLLAALAIPILVLRYGPHRLLQRPATAAPLLAMLLMIAVLNKDKTLTGDFSTLLALIAPLAATGVALTIDAVRSRWLDLALADWLVAWLILGRLSMALPAMAATDSSQLIWYADQAAMARDLDAALGPGDEVQCFDKLWFPVLTGRSNALPIMQIDPKGWSTNCAEGWSPDVVVQALAADPPAVIMVPLDEVDALLPRLSEAYVSMGERVVDASVSMTQLIYVRQGRDDLVALIDGWPQPADDAVEDDAS